MGKPFKKELENISSTIEWAFDQPIELLSEFFNTHSNTPLFIVGSGGSLSACYYAASLYQKNGSIAKAITPLELFYSKEALKNSKILFISASGKNTDILFSFNVAVMQDPKAILTFCMKKNSPLVHASNKYSISKSLEFDIPTKKDGFLATNSLVAYYTLLFKSFGIKPANNINYHINEDFLLQIKEFVSKLSASHSITILYGGWGQSVAYDIESKFTEAALGNILLADYRNFGHGRHHWFAKRQNNSAILALVTPLEKQIAKKSLELIPNTIPKLIIESKINSAESSIELLTKSFYLTQLFGALQDIDPGRPGVPEFGSKLYHLKYATFYKESIDLNSAAATRAVLKKTHLKSLQGLSVEDQKFWHLKYEDFLKKIKTTLFGSIVFDYDGTLCSGTERFKGLSSEITSELIKILECGVSIGIATGRGQSVRTDLQNKIPKRFWNNVIIGYYNGSDISELDDNHHPNKNLPLDYSLELVLNMLKGIKNEYFDFLIEERPFQLTLTPENPKHWSNIKQHVQNEVMKLPEGKCQYLQSTHSIDIIVKEKASKLRIVDACSQRAIKEQKSPNCLCIGDLGEWPGNDYELLSTKFSLSVDTVSADPDTCWNLSSYGVKNVDATLGYLKEISFKAGNIIFR